MNRQRRILVVDDDESVLFVLCHALARLSKRWEIFSASSGYNALRIIAEGGLDLLITDIRLPGPSGVQLTEALRTRNTDTPVIWISAHHEPGMPALARRLGVYRYLQKPLEIGEIRAAVRGALAGTHGEND